MLNWRCRGSLFNLNQRCTIITDDEFQCLLGIMLPVMQGCTIAAKMELVFPIFIIVAGDYSTELQQHKGVCRVVFVSVNELPSLLTQMGRIEHRFVLKQYVWGFYPEPP